MHWKQSAQYYNDINEGRSGWLEDPLFEAHYPVLSNIRCSTSNNTQTNFKTTGCIYQETQHLSTLTKPQYTITSDIINKLPRPEGLVLAEERERILNLAPAGGVGGLEPSKSMYLADGRLVDMKQQK